MRAVRATGIKGFGVALLLLTALIGWSVFFGGATPVEAQSYSAYSDPKKPALSFVLSREQNVEEFRREFGLGDEELETVLAAIREENEALARVREKSQQVIESNRTLPVERVRSEVEASGYNEKVEEAVARTKTVVESVLSADRRPELGAWVDEKWQQERGEVREAATASTSSRTASGKWFEVYATQYEGYTNYEVALPHRKLKFDGGYRAYLSRNGYEAQAPVKEVGPWNTYDNWWDKPSRRTMWKNLPRGLPEAEAAYYDNYNGGRDEFGRKVLNPAGVDLTPAVAARLGLKKYENAWIRVRVPSTR